MHADKTGKILEQVGYDTIFVDRIRKIILKKQIKKNEESQALEDTICLVFLNYYFEEFAAKHPDEKVIDILQKTWIKMSKEGQEAALKLDFTETSLALVKQAIA
jgi:hypothetical protein